MWCTHFMPSVPPKTPTGAPGPAMQEENGPRTGWSLLKPLPSPVHLLCSFTLASLAAKQKGLLGVDQRLFPTSPSHDHNFKSYSCPHLLPHPHAGTLFLSLVMQRLIYVGREQSKGANPPSGSSGQQNYTAFQWKESDPKHAPRAAGTEPCGQTLLTNDQDKGNLHSKLPELKLMQWRLITKL